MLLVSISINDVVCVVGVFKFMVLCVFGGGLVSEVVCGWVEVVICQIGYYFNLQVRCLCVWYIGIIGLIVVDICNLFFIVLICVVEEVVYWEGFCVIFCNIDEDFECEVLYLQLMYEECISGLIFVFIWIMVGWLNWLRLDYLMVLVDCVVLGGMIDSVVFDNVVVMLGLVEYLVECGYCCIGGLFGSISIMVFECCDGYCVVMCRYGWEFDFCEVEFIVEVVIVMVEQWLISFLCFEVLVISNSLLFMGVLKVVCSVGFVILGELVLVGFDNE